MNSTNKLPLIDPDIKTFQNHAFILSILLSHKDCYPWFYTNYIHLTCNNNHEEFGLLDMNFYMGHLCNRYSLDLTYLDIQKIYRPTLESLNVDINDFIKRNIDMGFYLYMFVDEKFIPGKRAYQKGYNFIHDILISGYDDINKKYIISGYSLKNTFKIWDVSYDDFMKAYENNNVNTEYYNRILLYKFNNNSLNFDFDLARTAKSIREYLSGDYISNNFAMFRNPRDNYIYGIKVYEQFAQYIQDVIDQKMRLALQPISVLVEHKKCMSDRIKYMMDEGFIEKDYNLLEEYNTKVVAKINNFNMLCIKYKRVNEINYLETIINSMDEFVSNETKLLEELLKMMERNI